MSVVACRRSCLPRLVHFAVLALFALPLGVSQPAFAADRAETLGGPLRLVPGPIEKGVAHFGLAIDLKPGWHTYWRYPGDSGVPPDLTSAGSSNVADVTVQYPAPMRFGDASDQTIGYQGSVVLPIAARIVDPSKPAGLTLTARLGVCRDICVPVDETLTLPIDPAHPASAADTAEVAAANAAVPQAAVADDDLSITGIRRETTVKPEMVTFTVKGPSGQLTDVFVEGPAGWALPLPTRVAGDGAESTWSFALDGMPSGAKASGAALTFTMVGKTRSTVQSVALQ